MLICVELVCRGKVIVARWWALACNTSRHCSQVHGLAPQEPSSAKTVKSKQVTVHFTFTATCCTISTLVSCTLRYLPIYILWTTHSYCSTQNDLAFYLLLVSKWLYAISSVAITCLTAVPTPSGWNCTTDCYVYHHRLSNLQIYHAHNEARNFVHTPTS